MAAKKTEKSETQAEKGILAKDAFYTFSPKLVPMVRDYVAAQIVKELDDLTDGFLAKVVTPALSEGEVMTDREINGWRSFARQTVVHSYALMDERTREAHAERERNKKRK
jgi:hypothetical protein